jgi:hypothetical protein
MPKNTVVTTERSKSSDEAIWSPECATCTLSSFIKDFASMEERLRVQLPTPWSVASSRIPCEDPHLPHQCPHMCTVGGPGRLSGCHRCEGLPSIPVTALCTEHSGRGVDALRKPFQHRDAVVWPFSRLV